MIFKVLSKPNCSMILWKLIFWCTQALRDSNWLQMGVPRILKKKKQHLFKEGILPYPILLSSSIYILQSTTVSSFFFFTFFFQKSFASNTYLYRKTVLFIPSYVYFHHYFIKPFLSQISLVFMPWLMPFHALKLFPLNLTVQCYGVPFFVLFWFVFPWLNFIFSLWNWKKMKIKLQATGTMGCPE